MVYWQDHIRERPDETRMIKIDWDSEVSDPSTLTWEQKTTEDALVLEKVVPSVYLQMLEFPDTKYRGEDQLFAGLREMRLHSSLPFLDGLRLPMPGGRASCPR
jgi:hypothetical protein